MKIIPVFRGEEKKDMKSAIKTFEKKRKIKRQKNYSQKNET